MPILYAHELENHLNGTWIIPPESSRHLIRAIYDDNREVTADSLFIAIGKGTQFISTAITQGAATVITEKQPSPDLYDQLVQHRIACFYVEDALQAFHQCAALWRSKCQNLTVIGLTGSCGKTTTKEIIAAILQQQFGNTILKTHGNWNNHFGLPRMLCRLRDHHRFAILEMGTNHPGEIEILTQMAKPDVALITNIGHAHLEFFKTTEAIALEKSSIFNGLDSQKGIAIYDAQTPHESIVKQAIGARQALTFGFESATVTVQYHGISQGKAHLTLTLPEMPPKSLYWNYLGQHQALNAAAAAAVAWQLNIPLETICTALEHIPPVSMRMETITIDQISWINDAYNANPDSTKAGLHTLRESIKNPQKLTIILGDMKELGDTAEALHREILELAEHLFPQSTLIAIGDIMSSLRGAFPQIYFYSTTQEAKEPIWASLAADSVVYLKGSRGIQLEQLIPLSSSPY